jgi:hypothetical protein
MDLSNYVDVPTRFAAALERWPELRIVENRPEVITVGDKVFIAVTVQAWRTPDDPIPAQGTAWEPIPGLTPFTKNSEMMNASTSALGRVLGFMMSFGPKMASAEEVRNRQQTNAPATLVRQPEKPRTASLGANSSNAPTPAQMNLLRALDHQGPAPETKAEASRLIEELKGNKA